MLSYEELLEICPDVQIKEKPLAYNLQGLYLNSKILIELHLTQVEKRCVLGEELGHHHTTVGNILDSRRPENAKQEKQSRGWGYNLLVPLHHIADALEHCTHTEEFLEYLEVTPEYLLASIAYYEAKYGTYYNLGSRYICFSPLRIVTHSQLQEMAKDCYTSHV